MAEYQAGKGTTALGIIGTALGGLATAAGGGLLANAAGGQTGDYITKEVFDISMALNKAETQNALLEAKLYNEHQIAEVKDYQAGINATQAVTNSLVTSQMAVMQSNINQLMGLTQLVIPNSSSAPGWGPVTVFPQMPTPPVQTTTPASSTTTTSAAG